MVSTYANPLFKVILVSHLTFAFGLIKKLSTEPSVKMPVSEDK